MAKGFISIVPRATLGGDTVSNVFWYALELGLETAPSTAQQDAAIASWVDKVQDAWLAGLPEDLSIVDVTARGFEVDGSPSEVLPSIATSSGAGSATGNLDGRAHIVSIRFSMSDLVAFSGNAGALRSSRLEYGPLTSDAVDNDGIFVEAGLGGTHGAELLAAVVDTLDIDDTDDGLPVRVSHVDNHLPTANVVSYRLVIGATFKAKTGLLRRRTNLR